jgi:hypothetical protein
MNHKTKEPMKAMQRLDTADEFAQLIQQGAENWIKAGKLVAECIDEDSDWPDKVNKAHPEIGLDMIYAFERVGRMELHPKLLMCDSPGARKLRRMPYALQTRYLNEPVELLVNTDGQWEPLRVSIHNLTPAQAAQVFDGSTVRSQAAQRAWFEDRKASSSPGQFDDPYRVTGRKLIVMQPCQLTAKQLAQILAQME